MIETQTRQFSALSYLSGTVFAENLNAESKSFEADVEALLTHCKEAQGNDLIEKQQLAQLEKCLKDKQAELCNSLRGFYPKPASEFRLQQINHSIVHECAVSAVAISWNAEFVAVADINSSSVKVWSMKEEK